MATKITGMVCPNCKSERCYQMFDSLSYKVSAICPSCGYDYLAVAKRDGNGELMVKDPAIGTREWDNIVKEVEEECIDPYGCLEYKFSDGITHYESIPAEEAFNERIQKMDTSVPDLVSIKLSRYAEGELHIKTIFSK